MSDNTELNKAPSHKQIVEAQSNYLDDPRLVQIEQELSTVFVFGEGVQRKWNIGKKLLTARLLIPSNDLFSKWVTDKMAGTEIGSSKTRTRYMKLARLQYWQMINVLGMSKTYELTDEQCDKLNARWDEVKNEFNQPIDDIVQKNTAPNMNDIRNEKIYDIGSKYNISKSEVESNESIQAVLLRLVELESTVAVSNKPTTIQNQNHKAKKEVKPKTTPEENEKKLQAILDKQLSDVKLAERVLKLKHGEYTLSELNDKFFSVRGTIKDPVVLDNYSKAYMVLKNFHGNPHANMFKKDN